MKTVINSIEVKLNKLIMKLSHLELERLDLHSNNSTLNTKLQEQEKKIEVLQDKVKLMNISRAVDTDEDDVKATRLKINEYVREIDKCIALLNK